jgi:hypothetical protein
LRSFSGWKGEASEENMDFVSDVISFSLDTTLAPQICLTQSPNNSRLCAPMGAKVSSFSHFIKMGELHAHPYYTRCGLTPPSEESAQKNTGGFTE